jgi:hypothetical protein
MPTYEIAYNPRMGGVTGGLETKVDADQHVLKGKFVVFYKDGEVVLQVASSLVLQTKTAAR